MSTTVEPDTGDPSLAEKVAFLRDRAWPGMPVEVVETHMSCVFLVAERAYKMKKPVRKPYLDHRSSAARRSDCEAEVELNQPLAPGVYLGVERLCVTDAGDLHLGGVGRPVEWLVVMRRLDRTAFLDHRIRAGVATTDDLEPVLDLLASFYGAAPSLPAEPDDYRRSLAHQVEMDLFELARPAYGVEGVRERVGRALLDRIAASPDLASRAVRLVEGHGDLRPQHVRPGPEPLVLDRLSFDPGLRRIDPYLDLALLAVECERLGAPALGHHVLTGYGRRAEDPVGADLLDLYRAVRATTRARLSIAHLDDHGGDAGRDGWVARCDEYLRIATSHTSPLG